MKKLFTLLMCLLFVGVGNTFAASETHYYDFHYDEYPWWGTYSISGKVDIAYTQAWSEFYLTESGFDFSPYTGWEITISNVSTYGTYEWGDQDVQIEVKYSDDTDGSYTPVTATGTFTGTFTSTTGYIAVQGLIDDAYCTVESAYLLKEDGTKVKMSHPSDNDHDWGFTFTAHEVGALTFTTQYGGTYLLERESGETATFKYGEGKIMRLVITFSEPLAQDLGITLTLSDETSVYPWPYPVAGQTEYTYDISDSTVSADVTQITIAARSDSENTFPWTAYFETIAAEIIDADSPTEEITVSSAGYATYFSEFAYTMPEGLTGYTITGVEDGVANLNEAYVAQSTVPAETALLIEGSANTYTASIVLYPDESVVAPEGNMLYGSIDNCMTSVFTENGDVTDGYYFYMLSYDSTGANLGFYWGEEGGAPFSSESHKAWLAVPSTQAQNGISLKKGDEDSTGISSVESATEGATVKGIYTIQGVRVSNMNQPGLYIVDGKKVLVK